MDLLTHRCVLEGENYEVVHLHEAATLRIRISARDLDSDAAHLIGSRPVVLRQEVAMEARES